MSSCMPQCSGVTMEQFGYQIVRIIKTSSLGVGSYGAVFRALCDELPCAAKILHPTLFETNDPGKRKIAERFEQECQFLSSVKHPNIVQYLGVSRDPESGLPVLLMELMDSSLTRFLEQSEEPLPFHIQVDICHNIALALAYLHSNRIIHRDLSSNNVLLIGPGNRAKVTDFGMSKLADTNPCMTPMTMCPGTLAYMPPEALDDPPVYTYKLDCFSFGVLDIQILTRQFPKPTQRFKKIEISDPRVPDGTVKVPIPEVERRQSHIDLVSSAHTLLSVALDCLKNSERERPSAQELCHHLAALKEAPQYGESVQQAQRATTDGESVRIRELRAETQRKIEQQHTQQIENLQQQLQEKDRTIAAKERQLQQLNQQVRHQSAREGPLHLHWSKCGRAPCEMVKPSSAVDGNMIYLQHQLYVYSYNFEKKMWSSLPQCPCQYCGLAVVDGLLTAIGGRGRDITKQLLGNITNQLFSLTGERLWVEHFPHMPTKRYGAAAVCSTKSLVVAGGDDEGCSHLNTVEVMDTETRQWSTASSLPFALRYASATICQDHIYLLGHDGSDEPRSVLACSMADLLQSCQYGFRAWLKTWTTQAVWHRIADLPFRSSSCATLCGQLLAVGGSDDGFHHLTTAIHQYNPAANSWEVISRMPTARYDTLVAVLPDNKLMVVGGYTSRTSTNIVEIATLQE